MENCPLCERKRNCAHGKYPYLIHEFKNSFLVLGEQQFHAGYCVLFLKDHFREMTDLSFSLQVELLQEMMQSSQAIQDAYRPTKMNLCSLGNVVEHLHWHFFPRYETDPHFKQHPWHQEHLFSQAAITPDQAQTEIRKIKNALSKVV